MSRQRDEFIAVITEAMVDPKSKQCNIFAAVTLAQKLMRIGRECKTNSVRLCNGEIEQDKYDAKKESMDKRLKKLLDSWNYNIGGDPRGYTLRIPLPTNRHNTMGNDGWGVPNS